MRHPVQTSSQMGPLLRRLRLDRKLSQADLGQKIGISQERVSKIENHPETVSLDQLLTLMMVLGARFVVETENSMPENPDHDGGADNTAGPGSW